MRGSGIEDQRIAWRKGISLVRAPAHNRLARTRETVLAFMKAPSQNLRDHFLAWQCRIRQIAMRQDGGRPSPGMRPRVLNTAGREVCAGADGADRAKRVG